MIARDRARPRWQKVRLVGGAQHTCKVECAGAGPVEASVTCSTCTRSHGGRMTEKTLCGTLNAASAWARWAVTTSTCAPSPAPTDLDRYPAVVSSSFASEHAVEAVAVASRLVDAVAAAFAAMPASRTRFTSRLLQRNVGVDQCDVIGA